MDKEKIEQIISEKMEDLSNSYSSLKEIATEEELNDTLQKLLMIHTILLQLNQIFTSAIYDEKATSIILASEEGANQLVDNFKKQYVEASTEAGLLAPIPDLDQLVSWIEELHKDITSQLFDEDFHSSVIVPALTDISAAVLETAIEEEKEMNDEAHD